MRTPFEEEPANARRLPRESAEPGAPSHRAPGNRRRAPVKVATEAHPEPKRPRRWAAVLPTLRERLRGPVLFVSRVALTLVAVAAAVALYRVIDRWVRSAPEFALTEIAIDGEERLSEAELRAVADVQLGDNVFARSPEDIRVALLGHPWVADVEVARRLPGTLRIELREHEPVALLLVDDPYLVASDGTVIKRAEAGDPMDLPIVTGVERARFVTDLGFRTQLLATIVALIAEYDAAGLSPRATLSEIHVEPGDEMTLFVGDEVTEVRLGAGPYRRKLERFARVLDELRREEARAAYVFLDNVRRPDRVTVRLR